MQMRTLDFTLHVSWGLGFFFFLLKQCWNIAWDLSVMPTICTLFMFSQKTKDLKIHNMLNHHSQNLSSYISSCSALQLICNSEYSSSHWVTSGDVTAAVLACISCSQEGERAIEKWQTSHKLLNTNTQLQILQTKQHLVSSFIQRTLFFIKWTKFSGHH